MNIQLLQQRRARLAELLLASGGGVAILNAAPEQLRNADTHHSYRHDSHQFYLCGFPEPEAVLVIVARPAQTPKSILFCRAKNAERETWEGFRFGPEAAAQAFGFDAAFAIEDLDREMTLLIKDQPTLFYAHGANAAFDGRVQQWLASVRAQGRAGVTTPARLHDVRALIDDMRVVKDATEIDTMRRAAQISAGAHRRAMRFVQPGQFEYQVEAELLHEFKTRGAQAAAYGSIVAGGANSCVLHYVGNDQILREGDLLLIDAGCELDGYASDITRTFPVSGRFSKPQRTLYDLVLAAQHAAIAQVRPGASWNAPHDAAVKVLAQGMLDLGLLQGSLDGVLESGSYRQFYMHRTGHWLGMDVHDVGDYREPGSIAPVSGERPWRKLVEGMVLTVEPGIYVRPTVGIPEEFFNIGIRIEDDALVSTGGCEILSRDVPTNADEIEALMA